MKYLEINAPAKINIGLNIVSKRTDGYHNLETIFYPLHNLHDKLIIERSDRFSFACNDKSLACDESNLVTKAVKLMEEVTDLRFDVKIFLDKVIPMGGGLGGGSSDAAAILVSLNDMFSLGMGRSRLIELALQLGSDVPFFIRPRPSFGQSRGEILQEIDLFIDKPILIVNPGIHISTKEAFQNIVPRNIGTSLLEIIIAWRDYSSAINELHKNDFESYAFGKYPALSEIKESLYKSGAIFAQMSGSGSTIYGVFESKEKAQLAKALFPGEYFLFIHLPQ